MRYCITLYCILIGALATVSSESTEGQRFGFQTFAQWDRTFRSRAEQVTGLAFSEKLKDRWIFRTFLILPNSQMVVLSFEDFLLEGVQRSSLSLPAEGWHMTLTTYSSLKFETVDQAAAPAEVVKLYKEGFDRKVSIDLSLAGGQRILGESVIFDDTAFGMLTDKATDPIRSVTPSARSSLCLLSTLIEDGGAGTEWLHHYRNLLTVVASFGSVQEGNLRLVPGVNTEWQFNLLRPFLTLDGEAEQSREILDQFETYQDSPLGDLQAAAVPELGQVLGEQAPK